MAHFRLYRLILLVGNKLFTKIEANDCLLQSMLIWVSEELVLDVFFCVGRCRDEVFSVFFSFIWIRDGS